MRLWTVPAVLAGTSREVPQAVERVGTERGRLAAPSRSSYCSRSAASASARQSGCGSAAAMTTSSGSASSTNAREPRPHGSVAAAKCFIARPNTRRHSTATGSPRRRTCQPASGWFPCGDRSRCLHSEGPEEGLLSGQGFGVLRPPVIETSAARSRTGASLTGVTVLAPHTMLLPPPACRRIWRCRGASRRGS